MVSHYDLYVPWQDWEYGGPVLSDGYFTAVKADAVGRIHYLCVGAGFIRSAIEQEVSSLARGEGT